MTASPPPVDLDQIAAVLAAATPGPWEIPYPFTKLVDVPGEQAAITAENPADAAVIVALRNQADALVAELRALRATVAAVAALHVTTDGEWCNGCDFGWPCQTARALGSGS